MALSAKLGYNFREADLRELDVEFLDPEIDRVPDPSWQTDIEEEHRMWKMRVEADLRERIKSGDLPTWRPVTLPSRQRVVPLIGGSPVHDWTQAVEVLVQQALDGGAQQVQVTDLTTMGLWQRQQPPADHDNDYLLISDSLAPNNSSMDVFGGVAATEDLIGLLVDVLWADDDRSDSNTAIRQAGNLREVARELGDSEATLEKLTDAVRYAVSPDSRETSLNDDQKDRLARLSDKQIKSRQQFAEDLGSLVPMLTELNRFARPGPPRTHDSASLPVVALLGMEEGLAEHDRRLAQRLLAASLNREMNDPKAPRDSVQIVLGADHLSEARLEAMTEAADRTGSLLVLFYGRYDGTADTQIGKGSVPVAGFFRLSPDEAKKAAEFMGKEHKFKLTGYSRSTSQSHNLSWSESHDEPDEHKRGRLLSETMRDGVRAGLNRVNSAMEDSSGAKSLTVSGAESTTVGDSSNWTRVYEHILEPSTFQQLGEASLLVVNTIDQSALPVLCARDIDRSQLWSPDDCYELAE